MTNRLEQLCLDCGLKMNHKRRAILQVIDEAHDHPSVDEIYQRTVEHNPSVSIATVYRTINILADHGFLNRLELGDGKSRYEESDGTHHEHLIDTQSGKVVEFRDPEIADLIARAAARLGYRLVDYRLELFGEAADKPRRILPDKHHHYRS